VPGDKEVDSLISEWGNEDRHLVKSFGQCTAFHPEIRAGLSLGGGESNNKRTGRWSQSLVFQGKPVSFAFIQVAYHGTPTHKRGMEHCINDPLRQSDDAFDASKWNQSDHACTAEEFDRFEDGANRDFDVAEVRRLGVISRLVCHRVHAWESNGGTGVSAKLESYKTTRAVKKGSDSNVRKTHRKHESREERKRHGSSW
jgi:hypothetical protein